MKKNAILLLAVLILLLAASCGKAASQQSLSEKIAMEISYAGEREKEVEKKQEEAATQPEMNATAEEMYRLWDNAFSIVPKLPEASLNEADMEVLQNEERVRTASKDTQVQAAGLENRAKAYSSCWTQ